MKNKKLALIILSLAIISIFEIKVFAYTKEIAKATPYYIHPITGAIEDPGNNPGIGQGMTENVVNPQALIETLDDGRIFLSVRYNLANYIKNETFAVQNPGDENFFSVPAEVTAQTEETRDYRFEIPSKDVIVRATFFVGPMGRDVIFYYTISDPVEGNTDFVTMDGDSVSSDYESEEIPEEEMEETGEIYEDEDIETPNVKNPMPNMKNLKPVENDVKVGQILEPQNEGEIIEQKVVNSKFAAGDLGYSHGLLTKDSDVIKKIYYQEETDEGKKEKTKLGKITLAFIYALIALLVIITSVNLTLIPLSYFYKKITEQKLDEKRSKIYEKD